MDKLMIAPLCIGSVILFVVVAAVVLLSPAPKIF